MRDRITEIQITTVGSFIQIHIMNVFGKLTERERTFWKLVLETTEVFSFFYDVYPQCGGTMLNFIYDLNS